MVVKLKNRPESALASFVGKAWLVAVVLLLCCREAGVSPVRAALSQDAQTNSTNSTDNSTQPAIQLPDPLPEKVFALQNDNCGRWLLPPNQTNALIYDWELVYTYGINGTVASYQYTTSLKLPVFCLECQTSIDWKNTHQQNNGQTTDLTAYLAGLTDIVANLGVDAFSGSSLCLRQTSSTQYDFSTTFAQMVQENTGTNILVRNLLAKMGDQNNVRQNWISVSRFIHELNYTHTVFNDTVARLFKNKYAFVQMKGTPTTFWEHAAASTVPYDAVDFVAAPVSLATGGDELTSELTEVCEIIAGDTFFTLVYPYLPAKDRLMAQTLVFKGQGCFSCPDGRGTNAYYYSYITVPGYDTIPSNEEFKKEGVVLDRHCAKTFNS